MWRYNKVCKQSLHRLVVVYIKTKKANENMNRLVNNFSRGIYKNWTF